MSRSRVAWLSGAVFLLLVLAGCTTRDDTLTLADPTRLGEGTAFPTETDLLPQAAGICQQHTATGDLPLRPMNIAANQLYTLILSERPDQGQSAIDGWAHDTDYSHPEVEGAQSGQVQYVLCIRERAELVGSYVGAGHAYRLIWQATLVDRRSGEALGRAQYTGADPPSQVGQGSGDHYGRNPFAAMIKWLAPAVGASNVLRVGDPSGVAFAPDSRSAYLLNADRPSLQVWDFQNPPVARPGDYPTGKAVVESDGAVLRIAGQDELVRVDLLSGKVLERRPYGELPAGSSLVLGYGPDLSYRIARVGSKTESTFYVSRDGATQAFQQYDPNTPVAIGLFGSGYWLDRKVRDGQATLVFNRLPLITGGDALLASLTIDDAGLGEDAHYTYETAAISPDRKWLALCLVADDSVSKTFIWDVENGKLLGAIERATPNHFLQETLALFSPDGSHLIEYFRGNGDLVVHRTADWQLQGSLSLGRMTPLMDIVASPDGQAYLVQYYDNRIEQALLRYWKP